LVQPSIRFMATETAGGVVMLVAAVIAIAWANSPWHGGYETLWNTRLVVSLGDLVHLDELTLRNWVNDGLMALFFLVAGLEIKRQLVLGELRDRRAAALPAMAALGGMLVPALIYALFNTGQPGARGWGIPVATDIAFAVGVVALVGRRIPLGARIFILTLAVVDDIGGIVVIAVFYAESVSLGWLAAAAAAVGLTVVARRLDMRSLVPYLALGVFTWLALHEAGVEAAIAGVIFGLLTPTKPWHEPERFGREARALVAQIEQTFDDGVTTTSERDENEIRMEDLSRYALETVSPLERIEHRLNLWVSFVIVPLFAIANAGVRLGEGKVNTRVLAGVGVGLLLGKTIGVFSFARLAVALKLGRLPLGTTWGQMAGLAVTAGIGFTVALYITGLSFDDVDLTSSAKMGVLLASVVAGGLGYAVLRLVRPGDVDQSAQ
jgi:NhaA family Na+:H+ antiporter